MKKNLCIILSTMMVLLSLTSCSGAPDTKNNIENSDAISNQSSTVESAEAALNDSILSGSEEENADPSATQNGDVVAAGDASNANGSAVINNKSAEVKSATSAGSVTLNNQSSATAGNSSSAAGTSSVKSGTVSSGTVASSSKAPTSNSSSSKAASSAKSTAGSIGTFSMKDVNGNSANQSILNNYDLTMINVWATYCNPCIEEMPGINEVYNKVKGNGVNIIGIVSDGTGKNDLINEIVSKTGASYKMYIPSSTMLNNSFMSNLSFVPTTFFADKNGNLVGSPVSGTKSADAWLKIINERLKSAG